MRDPNLNPSEGYLTDDISEIISTLNIHSYGAENHQSRSCQAYFENVECRARFYRNTFRGHEMD